MMDTGQRVKLVKKPSVANTPPTGKAHHRAIVACVCCALLLPYLCDGTFPRPVAGCGAGLNGATMLLENVGSYVLVGVICFIAAVVVTVFCTRLRKKNNKQEERTKEDEEA